MKLPFSPRFAGLAFSVFLLGACGSVPVAPLRVSEPAPRSSPRASDKDKSGAVDQLTVVFGGRSISDYDDQDVGGGQTVDLGSQPVVGIEYSRVSELGFGGELGVFSSKADDTANPSGPTINPELSLLEITAGARYTYKGWGRLQPYAAVGLDLIKIDLRDTAGPLTAKDSDFGLYAHGGLSLLLGRHLLLGGDIRGLFLTDQNVDYVQVAGFVGFGF